VLRLTGCTACDSHCGRTLTQLATAKAGLILVNINPAYRVTELQFALSKVGVRALVMSSSYKSSQYDPMLLQIAPELASAKVTYCCAMCLCACMGVTSRMDGVMAVDRSRAGWRVLTSQTCAL
jgi:fatty-acyl-CoA synthase